MGNSAVADRQISALKLSEEELPIIHPEDCCIYRVPLQLRQANPEAYTPQMVLIGPLHHARKLEALEMEKDRPTSSEMEIIKCRYKLYMDMEKQKHLYLRSFCRKIGTEKTGMLRNYVEINEGRIRKSYAESTAWIKSSDFVSLILLDAIFIIEFMLRRLDGRRQYHDDLVWRTECLNIIVAADLILLENQLPYFVLEGLCNLVLPDILSRVENLSFRKITFQFFNVVDASEDLRFKHFTDLKRILRIRSLKTDNQSGVIKDMFNVQKLRESGVKFALLEKESYLSINASFSNGTLRMAEFQVDDHTEFELRNVIALEQCHYSNKMHVTSYVLLLDLLIDTERDVELLVQAGIIRHAVGHDAAVASMINRLTYGAVIGLSCYFNVAEQLVRHHNRRLNRICASLKHNYFNNLWKGTATVAAIVVLVLGIIQTIAALIQVKQGK